MECFKTIRFAFDGEAIGKVKVQSWEIFSAQLKPMCFLDYG